jgi:alpha-1,6-mannosyltransferase
VFRSELAIFLFTTISYLLYASNLSIGRTVLPAGLFGAAIGLLVSVPIDTFFWLTESPIWSEMYSFVFNVVRGQSSAWGISPWHFYFTSALPRLLLNPMSLWVLLPLPFLMPATRPAALRLAIPSFAFILIYSLQPHKEWRFIVYAIPSLTTVTAIGANWIWTRRTKTLSYQILSMLLFSSILASFGASTAMAGISSLNYPGGHALSRVHQIAHGSRRIINIHMDTLSCSTGVTRFYQMPPPTTLLHEGQTLWIYDKSEDEQKKLDPMFWDSFSYVLAERPEKVIGRWEIIETIDGFAGIGLAKFRVREAKVDLEVNDLKSLLKSLELWAKKNVTNGWWPMIKMEPRIHIMKREEGPAVG